MIKFLLIKFRNIILSRIYTSTKVIVYAYFNKQISPTTLTLKEVDSNRFKDPLQFEDAFSFPINEKNQKSGDRGFYGYSGNACVFRGWVSEGPRRVLFHKFYPYSLSSHEVYIHSCLTDKNQRGKGFYPQALAEIGRLYTEQKKTVLISTHQSNQASIKGILKAGFKQISEISVRVIMGIKKTSVYESE